MGKFTKHELEETYSTVFSYEDVAIINEHMLYDTEEQLNEDTRYFNNIEAYVNYVYLDNKRNASVLISNLVACAKDNNDSDFSPMDLILDDSDDIVLPNDRYILVMN